MFGIKPIMKEKIMDPADEVKPGLLKKKPKFGQVKTNPKAAAPSNLFARLTGK